MGTILEACWGAESRLCLGVGMLQEGSESWAVDHAIDIFQDTGVFTGCGLVSVSFCYVTKTSTLQKLVA